MKAFPLFVFSFSILLAFTACKKEKTCPGFDSADLSEFAYPAPDTLTFENDQKEQFQIFITEIRFSEPYAFECQDLYNVCPCLNSAEAFATDSKIATSYCFLKMEQSDVSEMQYFHYNVRGFQFEFDFINELPYIDQMEHLTHHASLTIGSTSYNDVIEIRNMDLASADIQRVYFNKKNGILRYIVPSTGETWDLIP